MKRRLFAILAALSLLLCVAVCALWVSSYWRPIELRWRVRQGTAYERWEFRNHAGTVHLLTVRITPAPIAKAQDVDEPSFTATEDSVEYTGRWVVDDAGNLRPQIVEFRDDAEQLSEGQFYSFFPFHRASVDRRVSGMWGVRVIRARGPAGPAWDQPWLFGATHVDQCVQRKSTFVELAHWLLAALLAVLPSLWVRAVIARVKRASRVRAGRCPSCGYDLRATLERCPECGGVTEQSEKGIRS